MSEQLGFLGLAKRACKLAAGEDAVEAALQTGKVRLLILAADAGDKTVRHIEHRSQGRLPILYLQSDKAALGSALGWASCAVAAMTDLSMSIALAEKMVRSDESRRPVLEALMEKQDKIAARKQRKPGKHSK